MQVHPVGQSRARTRELVTQAVRDLFPLEAQGKILDLEDVQFDTPTDDIADPAVYTAYKAQDRSYVMPVRVALKLTDADTGKVLDRTTVKLADIPIPDHRGSYILGGKDFIAYNQLRLAPGMYVQRKESTGETEGLGILRRGRNIRLFRSPAGEAKIEIGSRSWPIYPFLIALGAEPGEAASVSAALPDAKVHAVLKDCMTHLAYSPDPKTDPADWVRTYMRDLHDFDVVGDRTNEDVFGPGLGKGVTAPLLIRALRKMSDVEAGKDPGTDKDDLIYQEVVTPVDGLAEDIRLLLGKTKYQWARKLGGATRIRQVVSNNVAQPAVDGYLNSTALVNHTEERNPLQSLSFLRRITKRGEGGVDTHAKEEVRELKDSHIGFIDPVVSPESGGIGLVLQLASQTGVNRNRELTIPVHPVVNGVVDRKTTVNVTPWDLRASAVALPDDDNYVGDRKLADQVWSRLGGKMSRVPKEDVKYAFTDNPTELLDMTHRLIPFAQHNDTTRMLMGNNMLRQALDVVGKEKPLVAPSVAPGSSRTVHEALGEAEQLTQVVRAPAEGRVTEVTDRTIRLDTPTGSQTVPLARALPLNGDSFLTNRPVVKAGDVVRKGQLLADGWYTKDGVLAPGVNLRVGYMPWKGYNFEDGMAVSQSLVDSGRMNSRHLVTLSAFIPNDAKAGKDALPVLKGRYGYAQDRLGALADGEIREGATVDSGDVLVPVVSPLSESTMTDTQRMMKALGMEQTSDDSLKVPKFVRGKVVRVERTPGLKGTNVRVYVESERPLTVGSKLSGTMGNKGIITRIVPDSEMPRTADGRPLDVLMSPLTVPSRKNIGQLAELLAGKIAEKTGKPYVVDNLKGNYVERVLHDAKKLGISEKEPVFDPATGKAYELPVTLGNLYMLRLEHEAATTKYQARGLEGPVGMDTGQAAKRRTAERTNPQSFGEMEMRTLIAHGADEVLRDAATYRSGALREDPLLKRHFAQGLPLPDPAVPQSFRALDSHLKAAGLKLVPKSQGRPVSLDEKFTDLMLVPATDRDVTSWSSGEVRTGKMLRGTDLKPDEDGLFDPKIFGESLKDQRTRMGHVRLPWAVPNPLYVSARASTNPYAALTGLSPDDVRQIAMGDRWLDRKSGTLLGTEEAEKLEADGAEVLTGGEALEELLSKVDLEAKADSLKQALARARTPDERARIASQAKIVRTLRDNDIKPVELLFHNVPVAPRVFRNVIETQDGSLIHSPLNRLYQSLVVQADRYKGLNDVLPAKEKAAAVRSVYNTYASIVGTDDPDDAELPSGASLLSNLQGKFGLVRRRMMGRTLDLSGRSTLTIDPKLGMDEIGVPKHLAYTLYAPFVLRNLKDKGYTDALAVQRYNVPSVADMVRQHHPATADALNEEMAKRPLLINRAPTLHKYGLMAATGHPIDGATIKLNPFVFKGLGADMDGDTLALHVPASDRAAEQAAKTMTLSHNLINPSNNKPAAEVYQDALTGLAYATDDVAPKNAAKARSFRTAAEVESAVLRRELGLHDAVRVGSRTTTAGKAWVNLSLPEKYRKWDGMWNGKTVNGMLERAVDELPVTEASNLYTAMKDIGFATATLAPVSLGLSDYRAVDPKKRRAALARSKGNPIQYTAEVSKLVSDEVEQRPALRYMIRSGARGNLGQLTHIMGTRGVAMTATNKVYPIPIAASYADGLNFRDYFIQAHDSRRGVVHRSWKTFEPGAMARRLWHGVGDYTVKEEDCGDTRGELAALDNPADVLGHVLLEDLTVDGKVLAHKGDCMTKALLARAKGKVSAVRIRTPMSCRTKGGVCRKCYGALLDRKALVPLGYSAGTVAVQSLAEPMTQSVLSTFHTGTVMSEETEAGSPTTRAIRALSLSAPTRRATLAKYDGRIQKLDPVKRVMTLETAGGRTIRQSWIPKVKPVVNVGDSVTRGARLTSGTPDLQELSSLVGIERTRPILYQQLSTAVRDLNGGTATRNVQVIARALTSRVAVEDPGDSRYMPGDLLDEATIADWNAANAGKPLIVAAEDAEGAKLAFAQGGLPSGHVLSELDVRALRKAGQGTLTVVARPIRAKGVLKGTLNLPRAGADNWLGQATYEQVRDTLVKASVWGMNDNLQHNKARIIFGQSPAERGV